MKAFLLFVSKNTEFRLQVRRKELSFRARWFYAQLHILCHPSRKTEVSKGKTFKQKRQVRSTYHDFKDLRFFLNRDISFAFLSPTLHLRCREKWDRHPPGWTCRGSTFWGEDIELIVQLGLLPHWFRNGFTAACTACTRRGRHSHPSRPQPLSMVWECWCAPSFFSRHKMPH